LDNAEKEIVKRRLGIGPWLPIISPLVILVAVFVILEIIARTTDVAFYILPPPSMIIGTTASVFQEQLLHHFLFTFRIIATGFAIATVLGMGLAALFSQFSIITKAVTPVILMLVITPMITLIPIVILWIGTNPDLRVLVIILQSAPIITLNTLAGFTNLETEKVELAKSVGATKMQRFSKIIFMNAMPQVFTGIKLGGIFATIGAVSADFVAGNIGLGYRIIFYTKYTMTDLTYGVILIIACIGIAIYMAVTAVEKRVVVWKN